jgi:hypothetical protein
MLAKKSRLIYCCFLVMMVASCAQSAKNRTPAFSKNANQGLQLKSPLSSEQKIIEELTGKAVSRLPSAGDLKNKPLSTQHYFAGLRAAEVKNYIVAIKQFNTVLKKYPQSKEVKLAFSAKAKVYNEMGLTEPASLNMRLAKSQKNIKSKSRTASVDSQKNNHYKGQKKAKQ